MANGLRIRDRNTGQITLEITDRLTRVLGRVNSGTSNGSINVPEFLGNSPFSIVLETAQQAFDLGRTPTVTISGATLSWTFQGTASRPAQPATIVYGLY